MRSKKISQPALSLLTLKRSFVLLGLIVATPSFADQVITETSAATNTPATASTAITTASTAADDNATLTPAEIKALKNWLKKKN